MATPIIIVPGMADSGPEHWQSHFERAYPDTRRVLQQDWFDPVCEPWVVALDQMVREVAQPAVLVAHSIGVMTVVQWAARHQHPVRGALLVAPPDVEAHGPDDPPEAVREQAGWVPIPRRSLSFPSVVVASTDDPYASIERVAEFAQWWGSHFINIGAAGHINVAAGFGPWPEGERLLQDLIVAPAR
jgi:predicted alpha/beta hydrolase family esterase